MAEPEPPATQDDSMLPLCVDLDDTLVRTDTLLESVFAVLPAFNGLGFSVGRELKGTHGYFGTPREVRHWLYELMQNGAGTR